MAEPKKISELTAAAALTGTEEVPAVQSGSTVKTTAQKIADLASGEVNTASNVGTGLGKSFKQKTGVDLEFKSIKAGTNVTVTDEADDITISSTDTGEVNTASNTGTGVGQVFKQKTGVDLELKTIKAGTDISISNDASEVTINSTVTAGEVNTASNVGTGAGKVFKTKVGVDLRFKSIFGGTNITVANGTDDITINSTGGGDVTKVGTPVNNQVGVWTGDGTIEGNANFTWDGTVLTATRVEVTNAGGGANTAITLRSTAPGLGFDQTDAAVDNRFWDINVFGEQFLIRTVNDASTVAVNAITIDRTGTTIDSVTIANGSFKVGAGFTITNAGVVTVGTWNGTDIAVAGGGTGSSTAGGARTNLGLIIGTDVQAEDAGLTSIAALTTAADRMIYTTASDTYAVTTLTTSGRNLIDDASTSAQRTTLGLVIGTDVQAFSADNVIKTGTPANDQVATFTGATTVEGNPSFTYASGTDELTVGTTILSGSGGFQSAAARVSAILPAFAWKQTDAGVDDKWWDMFVQAEQFKFRTITDSGSAADNIMVVDRTNETVDNVAFPGSAVEIDGDLNHDGTNIGFYGVTPAARSSAYTRNATIVEDRTLLASASATTLNNNNVLAAIIADLQNIGILG